MKKSKKIIFGIGGLLILLLGWALFEPYTISVENEVAMIPNIHEDWVGEKVAVVSDFQLGLWMDNDAVLSKMVSEIIEIKPKVVLILGDFVYHASKDHISEMEKVVDYLKPLTENNLKVYAVLGNHDYGLGSKDDTINQEMANRVRTMLKNIEINVLNNESVALSLEEGKVLEGEDLENTFYLAGIGSNWAKEDDINRTLSSFPQEFPRFIMMHNPRTFVSLPANTSPMAVAGHTHGGQFRLPFSPDFSYLDLKSEEEVHVDGWIEEDVDLGTTDYMLIGELG